ncbi:MAG: nucleoside triphosphate pyrophosphohydrolase [Patescibacteria group bacterium]
MIYNKLVRDKIPDIILARGVMPKTHIADETEYWQKLKEKLTEEVDEFKSDESIAEIADIMEVINTICEHKGFDKAQIETLRAEKAKNRGGFKDRIILEES